MGLKGYIEMNVRLKAEPTKPFFFNHFEVNKDICTKNGLVRSLQSYYAGNLSAFKNHYSAFDSIPTTYIIDRNSQGTNEINQLIQKYKELAAENFAGERMPSKHC